MVWLTSDVDHTEHANKLNASPWSWIMPNLKIKNYPHKNKPRVCIGVPLICMSNHVNVNWLKEGSDEEFDSIL